MIKNQPETRHGIKSSQWSNCHQCKACFEAVIWRPHNDFAAEITDIQTYWNVQRRLFDNCRTITSSTQFWLCRRTNIVWRSKTDGEFSSMWDFYLNTQYLCMCAWCNSALWMCLPRALGIHRFITERNRNHFTAVKALLRRPSLMLSVRKI